MKNRAYYENLRDQLVADKVAELLKDDYYPFTKDNFEEFLQNMPVDDFEKIRVMAELTFKGSLSSASTGGVDVSKGAVRYWQKVAVTKAEKETPSVEELMADGDL